MKDLKYIQLFEAFESSKLSKTLKFINKEYRSRFLQDIKSLCNSKNFPLSEISDDLFEYLPYRKALSLHKDPVQKKCSATSESEFSSDVALPGEKCEEGKLKRSWGAGRVRVMTCPNCNGTGIEPFRENWKYLKFWFSADKKYITKTATNGVIYGDGTSPYRYDRTVGISYGSISASGWYWVEDNMEKSLKEANFALVLDLDKLEKKSKKVKNTKITQDNREKSRENALALQSNEDIKDQNIRRYFDALIERSKIKGNLDDIKNLHKLVSRLLCNNFALFAIYPSSDVDSMRKINIVGEEIYDIMVSLQNDNSQENQNSLINKVNNINYNIQSYINSMKEYKIRIGKSLELTKSYLNSEAERTKDYRSVKLFNNIMEINNLIYKYVSNYKVETLYDYESLLADLTTITELLSQKRYLYSVRSFFDRVASRWSWDDAKYQLTDRHLYSREIDSALEGTDRFIKFLKNKYSL
jgi:hypothetical protein